MNPLLGTKKWLYTIGLLLCLLPSLPLFAQDSEVSKGPFFIVKAEKHTTELLPLKSTSVNINIAGVVADVSITQEYLNTGDQKLEAIYIFPASTRAAVYDLKMSIGERTVIAKIAEKQQARREYEQAKSEGKTATLLEQHRPNVFQMSVGHILPNDKITVTLKYTELLVPENGVYELAFPTVVGPRYADDFTQGLADANTWVNTPYLDEGKNASYDYHIQTSIQAGMPIHQLESPSHRLNVQFQGKDNAKILLDPSETRGGTKDYILRYRLGGTAINSGLLLFQGEEENFFLAMIQPPQKVEKQQMPPREYIFILDVSGSMRGFPLDVSKQMLQEMVEGLRTQDRFNLMLFESGNVMLSPTSVPANKSNIAMAMDLMDNLQGGGGTELIPALKAAFKMQGTEGYSRSFIIITDGFISVEQEVFDMIRKNLGNANVFAVGAGSSVNRFLIDGIARSGQGVPLIVTTPEEAKLQHQKFSKYISSPALTNINIDFGDTEVYDVTPLSYPDLMSERPVIVYGKYRGQPKGSLTLKGNTGEKDYQQQLLWGSAQPTKENQALRYLWARNAIATLNDYTNLNPSLATVKEITKLGLDYNLLTNYTSFIAVDELSRELEGKEISVRQALPLPQGVQGSALNSAVVTASKPGSVVRAASENSHGNFHIAMPDKQHAFAANISIAWTPTTAGDTYSVIINDLMGNVLWQQETQATVIDIDLKKPSLTEAIGHALIISVESKNNKSLKHEVILEVLEGASASQFLQQSASLILAEGVDAKLALAKHYEGMGMIANALGVIREAMAIDKGTRAKNAYDAFLQRLGL